MTSSEVVFEETETEEEEIDYAELYTVDDLENLDDFNDDENEIASENDQDFFMMQYADFLNRLCHFKFIPYQTVQEISKEYLEKSMKSQEFKEKKLRDSLKQIPNMTGDMIDKVVQEVVSEDEFVKAQKELKRE